MRAGAVALRAGVPRLYGVIGTLNRIGPEGWPEPVESDGESASTPLPYQQRRWTPWFLASQLVPELRDVTVVDLDSGSGRLGPRNRYVADTLNRAGLGTLLLDLFTEDEERDRHNVFDVVLLARRLHAATSGCAAKPPCPWPTWGEHGRGRRAGSRGRP